jgi:TRAP-type C4-dicarboxylate transport system permease small subunit
MTWQVSSEDDPVRQGGAPGALRALGVVAVFMGVAALAVATFILSYSDIRTVALQAGIQPNYAKTYPLLIDAMLLIALAAVLALRGAGVPSRILSWLTLLAVLGAAAGADTLRATGRTLPHQAAATTAAVLPWALVLIAFVLLLAMLRHARLRRQRASSTDEVPYAVGPEPFVPGLPGPSQPYLTPPAQQLPVRTPQSWQSAEIVPGFTSRLVSSAVAGAAKGAVAADIDPFLPLPVAPPAADDGAARGTGPGSFGETGETYGGPADTDPGPAEAGPADTQAVPADADARDADADTGPAEAGPADTQTVPADADARDADADTGPAEAGFADSQTVPADADARDADADTGPAEAGFADTQTVPADADARDADTDPGPAEAATPDAEPEADQVYDENADDDMPVFHRMWSTPTPPEE